MRPPIRTSFTMHDQPLDPDSLESKIRASIARLAPEVNALATRWVKQENTSDPEGMSVAMSALINSLLNEGAYAFATMIVGSRSSEEDAIRVLEETIFTFRHNVAQMIAERKASFERFVGGDKPTH